MPDDPTLISFAVMYLARLFRKFIADVLRTGPDVGNGFLILAMASLRAVSIANDCRSSFLRAVDTDGAIKSFDIFSELQTGQERNPRCN